MQGQYSLDHKRYHTLYDYNFTRYGRRVIKAGLDTGMTCPNRDGTCGTGGCIYCEGNSFTFAHPGSVTQQLEQERERIAKKYPGAGLNAYFQNGTNTYAPVEQLEALWKEALAVPEVTAVSVATRADCLGEPVLEALTRLSEQTDLTVELGLQSVHDRTAERIHRGHDFAAFLQGFRALQQRKIRTCIHLINGLPGESEADMLESARVVGQLRPGGVKLHLLYVTRGAELEGIWRSGGYTPMKKEDYIRITAQQLRYFPWDTVIERLTGDGDRTLLLAPEWSLNKRPVLGGIDHEMHEKNIWQGELYFSGNCSGADAMR